MRKMAYGGKLSIRDTGDVPARAAPASHALAERYERRKGIAPAARVGDRLL